MEKIMLVVGLIVVLGIGLRMLDVYIYNTKKHRVNKVVDTVYNPYGADYKVVCYLKGNNAYMKVMKGSKIQIEYLKTCEDAYAYIENQIEGNKIKFSFYGM